MAVWRPSPTQRATLAATLRADGAIDVTRFDRPAMQQQVEEQLGQWRALLGSRVSDARQVLRQVLTGPVARTPTGRTYALAGKIGGQR